MLQSIKFASCLQINSYGGELIFTVLFTLPQGQDSEGIIRPDIVLMVSCKLMMG